MPNYLAHKLGNEILGASDIVVIFCDPETKRASFYGTCVNPDYLQGCPISKIYPILRRSSIKQFTNITDMIEKNAHVVIEALGSVGQPWPAGVSTEVLSPTADPDNDGVPTIIELLTGGDPNNGQDNYTDQIVLSSISSSGSEFGAIDARIASSMADHITFDVEFSNDLETFRTISSGTTISDDGTTTVVRFVDSAPDQKRLFVRIAAGTDTSN